MTLRLLLLSCATPRAGPPPPMSFFAEYNVSFNQECWPARGATFPTDLTVPLTSPIECMTPSLVGK